MVQDLSAPELLPFEMTGERTLAKRRSQLSALWRLARAKPLGAVSAAVLFILITLAVLAPAVAPDNPITPNGLITRQPPSPEHLFGTDQVGRDILSRVLYGARPSLEVGLVSVLIGTLIGAVIGVASGYFGGSIDLLLQRLMDAILSIPALVLAIAVTAVLGIGLRNVIIAIAIIIMPATARVVRGSTLAVRGLQYIEAAHAIGAGHLRIMLAHIVPNVAAPIIVLASIQIAYAILAEAALSFLGLGTQPPNPSWGADLAAARTFVVIAIWLSVFPGLALSIAVLAFNLLGDALRDVLDPRQRGAV